MDWVGIIQTLGFPIALVCAMGFFIFKLWEQSKEREDKYVEIIFSQNEKFDIQSKQLEAIALTQERILERLDRVEKGENINEID